MGFAAKFLDCFIPLFVTIDPIGLAAVYLALGRNVPVAMRRRIANQATWTGGIVALLFLFLGRVMFNAIGIGEGDFQIAGGAVLFVIAVRELTLPMSQEKISLSDDFGIVPLGMPLIAGPATITTLLVISKSIGYAMTLLALAANLVLVAVAFAASSSEMIFETARSPVWPIRRSSLSLCANARATRTRFAASASRVIL